MPNNYPKFDSKIQNQIDLSRMRQSKSRPGVVMKFDKKTNTAVVVLDDQLSGQIGNIIGNVPCPSVMGVQFISPEAGTRCLVGFRDDNESHPYIITYFNDLGTGSAKLNDYVVNTGLPKYMMR
jgi:hypothetical protein